MPQLGKAVKAEGIAAVFGFRQESPVLGTEQLDKKGLAVTRLTDQHKGHLLAGAPFGGILHIGNEAVDLVVHADGMLPSTAEHIEIIGSAPIHDNFFKTRSENHSGYRLKGILEDPFTFFHRNKMLNQLLMGSHSTPPSGLG